MKQTIIAFLLKERYLKNLFKLKKFKVLKNKKGFSLLEVLVAVAIIGIISAIAVPQFNANRKSAAKVAGATSIQNIKKAYDACRVLKDFTSCDSLGDIGVQCPDCSSSSGTNKFCAHIKKGGTATAPDFSSCISVDISSTPHSWKKTVGGSFLKDETICHEIKCTTASATACTTWANEAPTSQLKNCSAAGDCGTNTTQSQATGVGDVYYTCKKIPTTWKGTCSSSHTCE